MAMYALLIVTFLGLAAIASAEIRDPDLLEFLKTYRPTVPSKLSTRVSIGIYANSVQLDNKDATMQLHFYMRMSWRDERLIPLVDQKSEGGKVTKVRLDSEMEKEIWTPDIFFRNAISVQTFDEPTAHTLLNVNSTGHVWYVRSILASFSCPSITRYVALSNDVSCPIMFESFGNTMDSIYFTWLRSPVDVNPDCHIFGYSLVDKLLYDCSQNYTAGAFPCLGMRFIFRSDGFPSASRFGPYAAAFLLVLISWLGFWINGDDVGHRLGLGLMICLILTVQTFLGKLFIDNKYVLVRYEVYCSCCTLLVLATLLEYALAYGVFNLIPRKLATARKEEISDDSQPKPRDRTGRVIDVVCGFIVFPVIFVLFNIVFWALHDPPMP